MRIVLAAGPLGSRGDFQPLLAAAIALRNAGHDALLLAAPNFQNEGAAFGVPMQPILFDVEAFFRDHRTKAAPLPGGAATVSVLRKSMGEGIDAALPLARGADLVVGGGPQFFAPTVAEALGVPYVYLAYGPQFIRSAEHPPMFLPYRGPRFVHRLLWRIFAGSFRLLIGGPLARKRRQLGLPRIADFHDHLFPRDSTLMVSDPELGSPPSDAPLRHEPIGALQLPDGRALSPEIERFIDAGAPPLYIGFGSMLDPRPEVTTKLVVDAARAAGQRLLLYSGWLGMGRSLQGAQAIDDGVQVIGSASHALLFPRVSAVVHHGGAGTTAAAVRAGRPQLVVPHGFDQFGWGAAVADEGLGPPPIPRKRLTVARLAEALRQLAQPRYRERAAQLAREVAARDSPALLVRAIEEIAARPRAARRAAG